MWRSCCNAAKPRKRKDHDHQPGALLAAARLALKNSLWGKARAYLEASIGIEPRPEAYCELGNLLTQLGERDKAENCFRKGLELSVGGRCTEFVVHPSHIEGSAEQPRLPVESDAEVT